jgi:uncharacterized protein (DUF885 family)
LIRTLPLAALFLATACATAPREESAAARAAPAPDAPGRPVATAAAEDARLLAFLDSAFEESIASSPQTLTGLGRKEQYNRLNDYTPAQSERQLALSEAQLAKMKAQFDAERLSPAGRLSYRLFEHEVTQARENARWRDYGFPMSTNGSPAGNLPVFLINQHRVTSVSDAEAYIARIRETERAMAEISARVRDQAEKGIVPPKFNFAPVRADAKRAIAGAPFGAGADSPLLADFTKKVNALDVAPAEKTRLIGEARVALSISFRRGIDSMLATLDAVEPKATGNQGAWSLPDGGEFYAARLKASTTTDLSADQIHTIGLSEVARIQKEMEAIKNRVGFKGNLQAFFAHIKNGREFKYPNTAAGREQYLKDANVFIAQVMEKAPQYFRRLPKAPLEVRAVETWRQETASVAFYNAPSPTVRGPASIM